MVYTEYLGNRYSTVFLGYDHNLTQEGGPLLYETMVFPGDGFVESYCKRYASRAEAVSGHYSKLRLDGWNPDIKIVTRIDLLFED